MAMNPNQFYPGLSIADFFESYGIEAQIHRVFWSTGLHH